MGCIGVAVGEGVKVGVAVRVGNGVDVALGVKVGRVVAVINSASGAAAGVWRAQAVNVISNKRLTGSNFRDLTLFSPLISGYARIFCANYWLFF